MKRWVGAAVVLFLSAGCGSSTSEPPAPASKPLMADGSYRASAGVQVSGGHTTNVAVTGQLTNSYVWLGGGRYTETISGVGQIGGSTLDCTNPNEFEITLAEDGLLLSGTTLKTGCLPQSSIPDYTMHYRVVTGGMQRIIDLQINGQPATLTTTYLKQ